MKIKEFINLYNEGKVADIKTALEVKDYIPFAEKYELCSSTLEACGEVDTETGTIAFDNLNRNLTFIITALSVYTNLEFTFDENAEVDSIKEYDMLCRNKLIRPILDTFAEEYVECKEMLEIMQKDMTDKHNATYKVIVNTLLPIVDAVEAALDGFDFSNLNLGSLAAPKEKLN